MDKKVSVIVATYNSARTLDACLNSIVNQTYKNIELIVVDNSSKDNTKEIGEKYTTHVYDFAPERSAQRNHGAAKSTGEYVFFIDSDMVLTENVIKECVEKFNNEKTVGVIVPERSFGKGFWAACKSLEREFYIGNDFIEAARFFDVNKMKKIGYYDEANTGTEDYDLSQRVINEYGKDSIARIKSLILHDEGELDLYKTIKKKYYYAQRLDVYASKNKKQLGTQANIFYRYYLYFSKPLKLFRNPFIGIGMLVMKTLEFGAGAMGYLSYKLK